MKFKITLITILILILNFTIANETILLSHETGIHKLSYSFNTEDMINNTEDVTNNDSNIVRIVHSHQYNATYKKNTISNLVSSLNQDNITDKNSFYENLIECIQITHILDSYCCNRYAERLLHFFYYDAKPNIFFEELQSDNSLYFTRLAYLCSGIYEPDQIADKIIDTLKDATVIERSYLIRSLSGIYARCTPPKKQEIINLLIYRWTNMTDYNDSCFLSILYFGNIRNETNQKYDDLANNFGTKFYGNEKQLEMPKYFKFTRQSSDLGILPISPKFTPHYSTRVTTIKIKRDEKTGKILNTWYKNAYNDLINNNQPLDADFIFYWFRSSKNEIMIDLAREHIQNPDFKDARYKTVYYLVNHDFDYSFPILTNMVNNNSLHINEKKNFYRGLARLNKVSHSVLTKEQQQQANDYLLSQMQTEQDIAIKLYIDFLLSICVDEYGLSDDRTAFLNSLKETETISQEDIAQIDRRLKIIKYSIYMHSPSIFESYVNGLKTEKPFVDISKVEWRNLPVYEAKANGENWYYHDVNSEAYIARNTNGYYSANIVVPRVIDNYSVVALAPYAFAGNYADVTNIVVSSSVKFIGNDAFGYNTNLFSIVIPSSVTNVGSCAFSGSINLCKIYVEDGSTLEDEWFYKVYNDGGDLTPNCKIIRTKFENGLPVIPPEGESEAESP